MRPSESVLSRPEPAPEAPPPDPPPAARWPAILAALVAGLAAGYLAGAFGTSSVPRAAQTDPVIEREVAAPTTSVTVVQRSLVERVPDTAGGRLLAVTAAQDVELQVWSADQLFPRRIRLPFPVVPTSIGFDRSGTWMAAVTRSVWDASLYIGTLEFPLAPAFVGATSAVWHPVEAGRLAWTGRPQGQDAHLLYRGQARPSGSRLQVETITEISPDERLLAWGPWGYLVSDEEECPGLRVLGPGGEERARGRYHLLDADRRGDLLVAPCDLPDALAVADPYLERVRVLPSEAHPLVTARWSPPGDRLARVVRTEPEAFLLEVVDRDGRVSVQAPVPSPITLEWHDRRLIVMAARGGQVVFVDPETGAVTRIALEGRLVIAALR